MKRLLALALTLLPTAALLQAQEAAASGEARSYGFPEYEYTLAIVLLAAGIVAYAFMALFRLVRHLDGELSIAKQKLAGTYVEPEPEPVQLLPETEEAEAPSKLAEFFGGNTVAIEEEEKITLDHEYDGIHELDNDLPPWWTALFYATIAFGVVYLIHYHVLRTGPLSAEEYEIAMEKAEEARLERLASAGEQLNAKTVSMQTDAASLASGKDIYLTNCQTCHGPEGQGLAGAGPNFTDEYWIHGGAIGDLFTTIRYGVPTKGMIAWKDQLKPEQIEDVASYILSLQGTNPPNALPPQGERYIPEDDAPEDGQAPDGEATPDEEAQPADADTETAEAEQARPGQTASL